MWKKKQTYEISIASPVDIERIISNSNDSIFIVPVNIESVSETGIKTKSVVEEVIPANAVLTHRRGLTMLYFSTFWGQMISDVWTLSVTVNYNYGQWVNGHIGTKTGYKPSGSIWSDRIQKAVNNKKTEHSGSWTFSTSAYYPLSNYLGQTSSACKKWYPFHYSELKLYYTWIDGNE